MSEITQATVANPVTTGPALEHILRQHAENQFADELAALIADDRRHGRKVPHNWRLSPRAVVTYLLGGTLTGGFGVVPKYIGDQRLMEIAVATLTTDRALLLYGVPGTAKSWVSEHLAAAISGDSTLLVQGTAGTSEESMRYGWNYAQLLAHGEESDQLWWRRPWQTWPALEAGQEALPGAISLHPEARASQIEAGKEVRRDSWQKCATREGRSRQHRCRMVS